LLQSRDREIVTKFVQRQDVQNKLVTFGISPIDASKRIASLSDFEVRKMAQEIEKSKAGGDDIYIGIGLGTLIIIILLILLLRR
jgi:hypothetical protein